jgi:hypothetical protein
MGGPHGPPTSRAGPPAGDAEEPFFKVLQTLSTISETWPFSPGFEPRKPLLQTPTAYQAQFPNRLPASCHANVFRKVNPITTGVKKIFDGKS